MTPGDFVAKWKNGGDERRDFQSFFDDLCRMLGQKTPREADPSHKFFTYEYGANKTTGGDGWADVWKKGFFGFEAKGTGKDLQKAYAQLKMYADALENPPLLIVSDMHKFEIHTNFTATVKKVYEFTVEDLADYETRRILLHAFTDPSLLKPGITRADITKDAAGKFAQLAEALGGRDKNTPVDVAHFLNRLLFCMFAEDIELLPDDIFSKIVKNSKSNPALFQSRISELFAAMKKGGDFALHNIDWFNGGLFDDDKSLLLTEDELGILHEACTLNWSDIEPSIFGTLFEQALDPEKRSTLGAHYTDLLTIKSIVAPVVIEPWERKWEKVKTDIATALSKSTAKKTIAKKARTQFNLFQEDLRQFRVLDPACGSGNFLYVALRELKGFEHRVMIEAEALGLERQALVVGPENVLGIEKNEYAAELARITVWIGEIQWMVQNGHGVRKQPILQPLDQIRTGDALIEDDGSEIHWPKAHAIVGNPPFLGDRKLIRGLGKEYSKKLRDCYKGRVAAGMDLVCYWFEKSRQAIEDGSTQRVGLVCTQAITGVRNKVILKKILATAPIFSAKKNVEWDGQADVRVSVVCFGDNQGGQTELDGNVVSIITEDLTEGGASVVSDAKALCANKDLAFQGIIKSGAFDVDGATARKWLLTGGNPNGKPNSDVVKPWYNGQDITKRPFDKWIIDFGLNPTEKDASMYEAPFEHVVEKVKPERDKKDDDDEQKIIWWRLWCPRPEMRGALKGKKRYIATCIVSKQRFFVYLPVEILPSNKIVAVAREDDATMGVMSSTFHLVWAERMSTRHGVGNDPSYNPQTCFQTFPFPHGVLEQLNDPKVQAIAKAAKALLDGRENWQNPSHMVDHVNEVIPGLPQRIVPKPGMEKAWKKLSLKSLYDAKPSWLTILQNDLDEAVAEAYGWSWPLTKEEILHHLFALNAVRP